MATVLAFPGTQETEVRKVSLDEGYTRIANELIEDLLVTDLSGREIKILLCVIRRTYGFGKSEDWIALPQFEEMTGIAKRHVTELIKGLVDRKILNRKPQGNDQKLAINITVSEWQKQKKRNIPEKGNKHTEKGNKDKDNGNKCATSGDHKRKEKIENRNTNVRDADASQTQSEKKSSPKRYRYSDDDLHFAQYMFNQICIVTGERKAPNYEAWANTIRLIQQADGQPAAQIGTLFRWANKHTFWSTVVLSPEGLRKNWPTLAAQFNQDKNNHENNNTASQCSNEDDLGWLDDC